ncbi:HD-GYP domain-containing protein [Candidatus Clostridium radicumherbarum]|uniref:HD-GYP domain-containing protein n=1 Tax=Candidatus Clostridium radicumherbarum TaxID=3381662 RepID=A0ABW8TUE1_9CLOT
MGSIINIILCILQEKDSRVEKHSKRVSKLCEMLGEAMGLAEVEIKQLEICGLLHDIGKIAIDDNILNKPERLTEKEWNEVKKHPGIAFRILSSSPEMKEIAKGVLSHHERYDGLGYPKGLKQDEIPLMSRIIAVADSFDAMTSERVYKKPLQKDAAIKELIKNKGTQFDPYIVDKFVERVLINI